MYLQLSLFVILHSNSPQDVFRLFECLQEPRDHDTFLDCQLTLPHFLGFSVSISLSDFQAGTMRIGKGILQLSTSSYNPPHPIHSIQGTKHPTDREFIEIIPDSAAHQETVHKLQKLIRQNADVFAWPGEPPVHSRINRHKMYTDPVKGGPLKIVPICSCARSLSLW